MFRRLSQIIILAVGNIQIDFYSWKQSLLMWLLLEWFVGNSECSYGVYVYQHGKDTYFFQVVNLWQIFYLSVLWKHAASIKICSISHDASLIYVTISSSMSHREFWYHLNFSLQLSSLTVRSWWIYKYFCTIKCRVNHWVVRNPAFLTNLICHWSVIKFNNKDSDRNLSLPCNVLDCLWEFKSSNTTFAVPRSKLSCLKVIVPISKDHFWSDSDNFVVVQQYSCIVKCCFVEHRTSNINNNSFSDSAF